jgi:hypothetical protein
MIAAAMSRAFVKEGEKARVSRKAWKGAERPKLRLLARLLHEMLR